MSRPRFTDKERSEVFARSGGCCCHCKADIELGNFDVDHFPVVWRDISGQCYVPCCGSVVDGKDMSNLVAACRGCNRSHLYEKSHKIWCGHSQLRVRRTWVFLTISMVCSAGVGFAVGYIY
jgi:hypothetical protein